MTMELSPAASLSGYDMDVIELDGSTSLTLSVAGATSNAGGTLTWAVTDQPWHAGDQLMLRLRTAGTSPPTATPEPTATPDAYRHTGGHRHTGGRPLHRSLPPRRRPPLRPSLPPRRTPPAHRSP